MKWLNSSKRIWIKAERCIEVPKKMLKDILSFTPLAAAAERKEG